MTINWTRLLSWLAHYALPTRLSMWTATQTAAPSHALLAALPVFCAPQATFHRHGEVVAALAVPRPPQRLPWELPAPGGSLRCPSVSLPQEKPPYTEICHSAAGWASSRAAPLGDWQLVSLTQHLNLKYRRFINLSRHYFINMKAVLFCLVFFFCKKKNHGRLLYEPMSIYILCLMQVNIGIYVLWNITENKAPSYIFYKICLRIQNT